MTAAEAVIAKRSARAARANFELYIRWADQIVHILSAPDYKYDLVKALRNELTHFLPSTITMPVWEAVHGELDSTQRKSAISELKRDRAVLTDMLAGKSVATLPRLFGDLTVDYKSLLLPSVNP